MEKKSITDREFFEREPHIVARELLGKIIVRKIGEEKLKGIIVETESYFGEDDPASRAYKKKNMNFYKRMASIPGTLLVYMVHNNWLLNIVSHREGEVGAVLIRAVEPVEGIEVMKKVRKREKLEELTNGPGKFTQSFFIDDKLEGVDILSSEEIYLLDTDLKFEIGTSKRIGVKCDLPENYRFFIRNNKFVSK